MFIDLEVLLVDEEFIIFIGFIFSGFFFLRIDYLEIYGCFKEDFGWKEKLDVVLDLEFVGYVGINFI